MKRIMIVCALIMSSVAVTFADSPLTSTHFCKIYNVSGGKTNYFPPYKIFDGEGWGNEVMDIICGSEYTLEQRLCLVNYVGWNFDGQTHYQDLLDFYVKKNALPSKPEAIKNMSGEMLIVFAYVKAMDDYFDVSAAKRLAKEAEKRSPNSRAVAMISALIQSQAAMDTNWADVYRVCHEVELRTDLNNDFCDAAVWGIMEYINLYGAE